MLKGLKDQRYHEWDLIRHNAWLISVYSGLEGKSRRTLKPQKMFPLSGEQKTTMDPKVKARLKDLMKQMRKNGVSS